MLTNAVVYLLKLDQAVAEKELGKDLLKSLDKAYMGVVKPGEEEKGRKYHDNEYAYTVLHQQRVGILNVEIAKYLKRTERDKLYWGLGGLFHDCQKKDWPKEMFTKKREDMTPKEVRIIRNHAFDSANYLRQSIPEIPDEIVNCILFHHEKFSGKAGHFRYFGFKGEAIPKGARVTAVSDAFETVLSHRPYRSKHYDLKSSLEEIRDKTPKEFDPELTNALVAIIPTIKAMPEFYDISRVSTRPSSSI